MSLCVSASVCLGRCVIPYWDTQRNLSPSQTTSSAPPCCRPTDLKSTTTHSLKLHSTPAWRHIQCWMEVSWEWRWVSSTARMNSSPVVMLWTFFSYLWTTTCQRYFQIQSHCWRLLSPHPCPLQRLRGVFQHWRGYYGVPHEHHSSGHYCLGSLLILLIV